MTCLTNSRWLFCQNAEEAREAQNEMAKQVILEDNFKKPLNYIGGMDISNTPFDPAQMVFGAAVICSYPSLSIVETSTQSNQQKFPYVPGLLGFREAPTLVEAYNKLSFSPDVIMVDGHGISHPRGLGVASHLGVLLDIPTIGVAKSILIGSLRSPLPEEVGSMVPIIWKDAEIAMAVRTKKRCSPMIISAGHKITLPTAVELVLNCLKKYRLPEPTRFAHLAANQYRVSLQK